MKSSLSVLIITFNEEKNIGDCIESVLGWANDIYVIDSYSTDDTVNTAKLYGDSVHVFEHEFETHSTQLNWAMQNLPLDSDWTLRLDADERVTDSFKEEVNRVIDDLNKSIEGIRFRRPIVFLGKVLEWGEVRNNYDLRMWRTGKATYENRLQNAHAKVDGNVIDFSSPVLHNDSKTLTSWIHKHNQYSSLEARIRINGEKNDEIKPNLFGSKEERKRWLWKSYNEFPFRFGAVIILFIYNYIIRLGILDGIVGFQYAFLKSTYRYWVDLKIYEHKETGNLPTVNWGKRNKN